MNGPDYLFFKCLVHYGFVSVEKIAEILQLANQKHLGEEKKKLNAVAFVLEWLEEKEGLSQELVLKRIGEWVGIPFASRLSADIVSPIQLKYSEAYYKVLREYRLKLEYTASEKSWILLLNPWFSWDVNVFGKAYDILLVTTHEFKRWLNLLYVKKEENKNQVAIQASFQALQQSSYFEGVEEMSQKNSVRAEVLFNSCIDNFLSKAIRKKVSDIHFETIDEGMRIRYRLDGVLVVEEELLPQRIVDTVVNQLKIMGAMNVAEKRIPQEGSGTYTVDGKAVALRYSCIPTVKGENIVVRCMRDQSQLMNMQALGLNKLHSEKIIQALRSAQGLVLVTGPTGSGKTTSLYAMLQILSKMGKKIVSVEDPIEVLIPGVNQVQVDEYNDITFSTALKSFLRQSPEVIMIGEIRDTQTASIAIQSSFTGHLVLASLHTEDTFSAITRMIDLGIDTQLLSDVLKVVIAQRLVRKKCHFCHAIPDKQSACKHCSARGFQGRIGVFEVLQMDHHLREAIRKGVSVSLVRQQMKAMGFINLWEEGLDKVRLGITNIEELQRCMTKYVLVKECGASDV